MDIADRKLAFADGMVVAGHSDITIDGFVALVEANPDTHFKFNAAGDVVVMSPTNIHAIVQGLVAIELGTWLSSGALPGFYVATDGLFALGDWLSRPDVAIVPHFGKIIPREAPQVAVEIRSESNSWRELRAKAARYLQHGTKMVWLVDTDARSVEIHRPGAAALTMTGDDVIAGGDALPGFQVMVSELFPD